MLTCIWPASARKLSTSSVVAVHIVQEAAAMHHGHHMNTQHKESVSGYGKCLLSQESVQQGACSGQKQTLIVLAFHVVSRVQTWQQAGH